MASQWITLTKIGGQAGVEILSRFAEWVAARVPHTEHPDTFEWPDDICNQADKFVRELAEQASKPPVLFYCRYVDLWSMGDIFENIPGVVPLKINTSLHELSCYNLVTSNNLLDNLSRVLQRQSVAQEYRWYASFMREAVNSWEGVAEDGALIVIREPTGGLVEDHEIEKSLATLPDWL